jgi:hypothetical protein
MKTILIERVQNGFLVRPFTPCPDWACGAGGNHTFVYSTIEDVAKDLPRLMEHEDKPS